MTENKRQYIVLCDFENKRIITQDPEHFLREMFDEENGTLTTFAHISIPPDMMQVFIENKYIGYIVVNNSKRIQDENVKLN